MNPNRTTPRDPSDVFRVRMRELRKRRGLSQRELAERVEGLGFPSHQPAIARIEDGSRSVKLDEMVAIAAALDAVPEVLYREAPDWEDIQVAQAEDPGEPLTADQVWLRIWRSQRETDPKEDE